MLTIDELKERVRIDKNSLDDELLEEAHLLQMAAEGYANAASECDQAEQVLEEVDAKLSQSTRSTSVERITEARIKEEVQAHDRHISQYRFWIDKKKAAEDWRGLVKAFDKRAQMLGDLVRLAGMGHVNLPFVSADAKYEEAKAARRAVVQKESP